MKHELVPNTNSPFGKFPTVHFSVFPISIDSFQSDRTIAVEKIGLLSPVKKIKVKLVLALACTRDSKQA